MYKSFCGMSLTVKLYVNVWLLYIIISKKYTGWGGYVLATEYVKKL